MEAFSFLVLILLSLTGYSGGAVGRAGKLANLKPQLIDLILVLIIWGGAISSRIIFGFNRWLLILVWVLLSAAVGYFAVAFRRAPRPSKTRAEQTEEISASFFKGLWERWKNFSKRMGGFQSRIILSIFYFLFVTPFALAVKTFSDRLRLKHHPADSYWLEKREAESGLEELRRQF